jgi:hypothetical protein
MLLRTAPALAAALLLAACGGGEGDAAAPADSAAAAAPSAVDVPGRADDVSRARIDSANAAIQARESWVDELSREASGQGN